MKITTLQVAGFSPALKGMRNPMNSWSKNDTKHCADFDTCDKCSAFCNQCKDNNLEWVIGENDLQLATNLKKAGNEHSKYLRMIQVWADFDMPRYWWSEFDTYKIGTTANSCSTMHKLLNNPNPITLDLFVTCDEDLDIFEIVVDRLEKLRQEYLITKNNRLLVRAKRLLSEGFLQLRTVNLNYATISNIYHQRKHHRLKEEWVDVFCEWVESLPYAKELIIGE